MKWWYLLPGTFSKLCTDVLYILVYEWQKNNTKNKTAAFNLLKKAPNWQNKNQEMQHFCEAFLWSLYLLWQQCHNMTEENKPTTQKELLLRVYIKVQAWCLRFKQETQHRTATSPDPPPQYWKKLHLYFWWQAAIITKVGTPQTHFHGSWSHISFTANQTLSRCI